MEETFIAMTDLRKELDVSRDTIWRYVTKLHIELFGGPDARKRYLRSEDADRLRHEIRDFKPLPPKTKETQA